MLMLSPNDIARRFGQHIPTPEAAKQHYDLRESFVLFAGILATTLPEGREKEEALLRLEDASMWAHKAVAMPNPLVPMGVQRRRAKS